MRELKKGEIEIGILLPRRETIDGLLYIVELEPKPRFALRGTPEACEKAIKWLELDFQALLAGARLEIE